MTIDALIIILAPASPDGASLQGGALRYRAAKGTRALIMRDRLMAFDRREGKPQRNVVGEGRNNSDHLLSIKLFERLTLNLHALHPF